MPPVALFSAIAFPVLMLVGGIAAWRMSRKENAVIVEQAAWRDDSLDDWRKERDAEADRIRVMRQESPTHEGAAAEEKAETSRHQRIGG
jgi:hypothetical protein